MAVEVLHEACRVLDWGLAQVITLLAPETGVVGGGVSLIGETCFLRPLRREIARYVFPPLADSYEVVPPNSENSSSSTEPWRWRRWLRTSNVQPSNRPTVQHEDGATWAEVGRLIDLHSFRFAVLMLTTKKRTSSSFSSRNESTSTGLSTSGTR